MANAPNEVPDWTGESEEWVQRVLSELDPLLREARRLEEAAR